MVAKTNTAYRVSGVNQRIRLVAVEQVNYTEETWGTDFVRLVNPSDGYLDEVHAMRDRVAADIVVLIRRQGRNDSASAAAWDILTPVSVDFAPKAFAFISSHDSARAFAHELGHLMGLRHDRHADCKGGSCAAAAFPYAYGYQNCGPESVAERWRTIMAYEEQCSSRGEPRIFSSPELDHQGDPAGIAGVAPSNAVDGPSDAVRALNRTRAYVANFPPGPGHHRVPSTPRSTPPPRTAPRRSSRCN